MKTPVILHCSPTREDHGGIQNALAWHHAREHTMGFQPRFISFFDPRSTWSGDCTSLAGHGWERVGALRRRFAAAAAARPAEVAIYHEGWGLDWFAPLDGASRRVAFLHTEFAHSDERIRAFSPQVDGFLTVSRALADRVRRAVPDFPAERVRDLPYFVDSPEDFVGHAALAVLPARPFRLGYAGRICSPQKRLERLPELVAELDRRGVDYTFEVLGDGPLEPELRRRLGAHPRVKFLGWKQGGDYWRTVAGWHALVLFSDFEGFSRSAMEAMTLGVIPVHPDFSPAAAELLGPATADALYPVGNMVAAADCVERLAQQNPEQRTRLAAAVRQHMTVHSHAHYFAAYRQFVDDLLRWPRHRYAGRPPAWHDWMPLGVYTRLFPRRF